MDDMVILTRTYDLLRWILPRSERFPKSQRFVVTKRLQDSVLDFQETLFEANARSGRARLNSLRDADAHLNKLRLYLRLVHEWGWLSTEQYAHVSRMVAAVGQLLGGWIRQTRSDQKQSRK